MPDPQMRAADADRNAVVRRLGEHMAAGRLTVAEYEDRVARTYAAKTYGELGELTRDLPSGRGSTAHATPATGPRPVAGGYCGPWGGSWAGSHWRQVAWGSWSSTALIVTTIWLITSLSSGALLYFWPIWVIGPWGAVLLAQTLGGGGRRPPRDRRRTRV
jgi:Domain of unknown function (DUF1707)